MRYFGRAALLRAARAPAAARQAALSTSSSYSDQTSQPVAGLAWDLETTGVHTATAEIVQIAIVCVNSRREANHFSSLVLPDGEIDPRAVAVHGLSRQHLVANGAQ